MNLPNFIFNEAGTTLINYLGKEDSVIVPNNVTNIGDRAFFMTSVKEVVVPNGVKSIGKQCFWNCYPLSKIELPETLTNIKAEAFRSCLTLFEITLPKSLKKIGVGAFYKCNLKKVYYKGTKENWKKIQMEDGEIEAIGGNEFFSNREYLNTIVVFEGESAVEDKKEEIVFADALKNYVFPEGYEEYFYKETGVAKGSLELCCACFDEMTEEQKSDYVKTKEDPYGMVDFVKYALSGNHFACAWIAKKLLEGYSNIYNSDFFASWGKKFVQVREVNACLCYLSYAMQQTGKTNLATRCYRVIMQYGDADQKQKAQLMDFILKFSHSNNIVDTEKIYDSFNEIEITKSLDDAKNNKEWENFIFLYCVKKSASFTITEEERKSCEGVCKELGTPNLFYILEGEDTKVESDNIDELAIIDEARCIKEFSAWKDCWLALLFEYIEKYTDRNYNQYVTIFFNAVQARESYAKQFKDYSVLMALKYCSAIEVGDKHGQENAEEVYKQIFAMAALQGKSNSLVPLKENPSKIDIYECLYRGELGNFLNIKDGGEALTTSLKLLGETIEKKNGAYYLKLNLQAGEEENGVITYQARAHLEVEDNIGSAIITEDVEVTDMSNMIRGGFFVTISDNTTNIDMETNLDVGNDSLPFYIETIVDHSFNKMQDCTCDIYTTCERIGKNLVLNLEFNFNLSDESEDDGDDDGDTINFSVGGSLGSFFGSEDDEDEEEGEVFDDVEEDVEIDDGIDWHTITTYDGDCSVFVKFPGTTGYFYNCSDMISVGDKVKVSGKLAGRVGIVDRIGPWDDAPYMQNVVEIVKNEDSTQVYSENTEDETTKIIKKIDNEINLSSYKAEKTKKQKKKVVIIASVISLIIAFIILLTLVIIPNSQRNNYLASGEYGEIVKMDNLTEFTVPDGVTKIKEDAFNWCESLVSVTIPNSVKTIESGAFRYCESLKTIIIPDSVTSIGEHAFSNCDSLTSVTIGKGVTIIGKGAFSGCDLLTKVNYTGTVDQWAQIYFIDYTSTPMFYTNELYINNVLLTEAKLTSTTKITAHAFRYCESLTNVTIGNSVTHIQEWAFSGCTSLTKVNYTGTIDQWAQISFGNSSSNPTYYTENLHINNKLVTEAKVATATKINDYAFYTCKSLTNVIIGKSVTSVGGSAFLGSPIEKATIPAIALSSIKNSNLKEITITSGESIGNYALYNCSSLRSVTIGDSVKSIGKGAFSGCSSLNTISLPNSVLSIEDGAFSSCDNLSNIYITDLVSWCNVSGLSNITSYGSNIKKLYINNKHVTELVIPEGVATIPNNAFRGFSSLTNVVVAGSVTRIGHSAFSGCAGLVEIILPFVGSNKVTGDTHQNPFGYIFGEDAYIGGTATTQYYYGGSFGHTTSDTYYIPTSLKKVIVTGGKINYGAFYNCSSLTTIVIPNSVIRIEGHAFRGCTSLTSIEIPNSVTSIGSYVFYGCSSLTTVEIPDSVTSIGDWAFADCESLTSIVIPIGVTNLYSYVFEWCNNLTIYCEATYKPSRWNNQWNHTNCPVVWGYKG